MWTPTHVQLIVHTARNLKLKGKSGTNDCYATIHLGKEKYHTSIKEKSVDPEWNEECDFSLDPQQPKQSLKLCLYHRNFIGLDDFLGQTEIFLDQFNAYERPRKRWFPLYCKTSSKKQDRSRGEIELTAIFMVQSTSNSVCNLERQKKPTKSISFKNLSGNIGNKLGIKWPSKTSLSGKSDMSSGNFSAQSSSQKSLEVSRQDEVSTNAVDSVIVSSSLASLAEEDSAVDSKRASFESCINMASPSQAEVSVPGTLPLASLIGLHKNNLQGSNISSVLSSHQKKQINSNNLVEKSRRNADATNPSIKSNTMNQAHHMAIYELHEIEEYRKNIQKSLQINEKSSANENLRKMFESFTSEDLVQLIIEQKQQLSQKDDYIRDLEDYIDNLLVKVIETQPKLLQKPCLEAKLSKEQTQLGNIMHYSTMPRSYNQTNPSAKPLTISSYSNRKKHIQSFWSKGSFTMSPFKKLQAFMK